MAMPHLATLFLYTQFTRSACNTAAPAVAAAAAAVAAVDAAAAAAAAAAAFAGAVATAATATVALAQGDKASRRHKQVGYPRGPSPLGVSLLNVFSDALLLIGSTFHFSSCSGTRRVGRIGRR